MAHGGGGAATQRLLETVFYPALGNPILDVRHDSATLALAGARLAFTIDSYVVVPLFFPGGDIATLAVNGTVNDLAMSGARPLWLSAGFVLAEGLPIATLRRVVQSMRAAADAAGVAIVAGDTKVVERSRETGLTITTAGVGRIEHELEIRPTAIRPGDAILLSGDVGRHGLAVLTARGGLALESELTSDCAPVHELVLSLLAAGLPVHCLRDPTRGGLATALVEIATTAGMRVRISEEAIPVREDVLGACELLGFDPLYVANEGCFVVVLPEEAAERALAILRAFPVSAGACRIGEVQGAGGAGAARVVLETRAGSTRVLDRLSGEQLPRIC